MFLCSRSSARARLTHPIESSASPRLRVRLLEVRGQEGAGLLPGVGGGGAVVLAAGGIREGVVRVVGVELVLHPRLGQGVIERLHLVRRDPAVLEGADSSPSAPAWATGHEIPPCRRG